VPVSAVSPTAGDRLDVRALGLEDDIERHWQSRRRRRVARRLGHIGPDQPVDQPDLTAGIRRHIGAVHPVDDARQHEARIPGIKQRAVEQLKVEGASNADGLAGMIGLMSGYVSVEFAVERATNPGHRWQCEQLTAGEGSVVRSSGQHDPSCRESAAIEFTQSKRIYNRRAALERRERRRARRETVAR
jgi:hypothetical protein